MRREVRIVVKEKCEVYNTHVQLPKELKLKVDDYRKAHGMTLQGLIKLSVEEYLKAHKE